MPYARTGVSHPSCLKRPDTESALPRGDTIKIVSRALKSGVDGCEDKTALLHVYNDATHKFSDRVAALHAKIGVTPKHEYHLLERSVEDARLTSEQARIAYERHVADHGC
jgi:hypothetical protein